MAAATENEYDPRRESLVVEIKTTWAGDLEQRVRDPLDVVKKIHAEPELAARLEYIRCPSGLIRHITITETDLDRLHLLERNAP